jgi:hypothetical protein
VPLIESKPSVDFGIRIEFDRDSPDPARVFRAMSGMIDSFQNLDRTLVNSIDVSIEPVLMLEDIEARSLITWLRAALSSIDDEALKSGDWKKIVGSYLARAKFVILRFLEDKEKLPSRDEIERLQGELAVAAQETGVKWIPAYIPVPLPRLLANIQSVNEAVSQLGQKDKATFMSADGDAGLNRTLQFSLSDMEALLTREVISNDSMMILKVKKPDYLGESKWEFIFTRGIEAKILDAESLLRFQNRLEDVRPGDALRAQVRTEISYGYEGDVIGTSYSILKVIEVIRFSPPSQGRLLS